MCNSNKELVLGCLLGINKYSNIKSILPIVWLAKLTGIKWKIAQKLLIIVLFTIRSNFLSIIPCDKMTLLVKLALILVYLFIYQNIFKQGFSVEPCS